MHDQLIKIDKLSSPVISKISAQTSDFYAACLRSLKSDLSYIDSRCPRVTSISLILGVDSTG